LIVEDEVLTARRLAQRLTDGRHVVSGMARSAGSAMQMLEHQKIDAAFGRGKSGLFVRRASRNGPAKAGYALLR
jgi:hypothetical protein